MLLSSRGEFIMLEYKGAATAMKSARKIASEMGRSVTVSDEDGRLVAAVPSRAYIEARRTAVLVRSHAG